MDSTDLDPRDLFDWSVSPGTHRLAGVRAVIIDAGAFTLLPSLLAEAVGEQAVPRLLRDLGFAQGWLLADRVQAAIPATAIRPWPFLAYCAATLGLGRIVYDDAAFPGPVVCRDAFEAERVSHDPGLPRDARRCDRLAGFISGVASRVLGRSVLFTEQACVRHGPDYCRFVPAPDAREIAVLIARLRTASASIAANDATRTPRPPQHSFHNDLGLGLRSPHMQEVMKNAAHVAPVDSTVLITGESGVGKERLAQFLHHHSRRVGRAYVPVNCAAIAESLLESELFGHKRGAFTGATDDKPGLFEAAHGGTILLDEIGEISLTVQAKLLRVLQDHHIRRVGDIAYKHVDVRIVAATNRDLRQEVTAGRFREDLFYRLNVVELHVPALRERPEDLRDLLRTLLARTAHGMKRAIDGYAPEALNALLGYHWPGNIRELENAIEHACVLAEGSRITLDDLPADLRQARRLLIETVAIKTLRDMEREHILAALRAVGGHRERAAELLQVPRTTFFRKLRKLRIAPEPMHRAIQNGTPVPK